MSDVKVNGLILGTFMPFHKGHELLINFGKTYINTFADGKLLVILSSRNIEPIPGQLRVDAIKKTYGDSIKIYHHDDDNAPQNPVDSNDEEFWKYWKNIIIKASIQCDISPFKFKYVFSSEDYGDKLAKVVEAEHINFDTARSSINISGTKIRNEPVGHTGMINEHMITAMRRRYVMFGAESVGKTTTTKHLGKLFFESQTLPEFARPYLERMEDKSPSVENMKKIFMGQYAIEQASISQVGGSLLTFMDTDVMSTFGYARLVKMKHDEFKHLVPKDDKRTYFILKQEEVPFEKDILRYGGDVRETGDDFWIKLLEEHGMRYFIIRGNYKQRIDTISQIINDDLKKDFKFDRS